MRLGFPLFAMLAALALSGCAYDAHWGGHLPGAERIAGGSPSGAAGTDPAAARDAKSGLVEPASWGSTEVIATLPPGPHAVADADGPYLLDSGDRLRVFVYGQPNLSRIYTVDHDGQIAIPLIGIVHARAMTTRALAQSIRHRLATEYVKDPHVTVDIHQNRPFFVLGEVRSAGQFPYVSGMTVETAVAIAGGFSERADETRARITRRVNGFVEVIEVPSDFAVRPGDTIYVYERYF